jgi:hypothetical protein
MDLEANIIENFLGIKQCRREEYITKDNKKNKGEKFMKKHFNGRKQFK